MSQRFGPYNNPAELEAVVRALNGLGETVQIEQAFYPYAPKYRQYEAYIIRSGSA